MKRNDAVIKGHLARLKEAIAGTFTLATLPSWIEKKTSIAGAPFRFKNHEYQHKIASDVTPEKVVRKCSQIGISEMSARMALGLVNILNGFTVIYTLPTAAFAKVFARTRVDPIISNSPALKMSIHSDMNNNEVKQFNDSFLYIRGTVGAKAAISVPADAIFNDEVDFSDPDVLSTYTSRLTHSSYKIKLKLSTPTVTGYGISYEFEASRRHWNMVKCNHCNYRFIPDYFKHIQIPGYHGEMKDINKVNINKIKYKKARLLCPHCGKSPSLQVEHREWVVENPDDNYEVAGYQIQPFDAPNIISLPDLIMSSTKYKRYVDFINFSLGLPAEDAESKLGREEIRACFTDEFLPGFWTHVMGVDMGMQCHIMVSGVDSYGRMFTVHTEIVPIAMLQDRYEVLRQQYRVNMSVMDSLPYTETLIQLQKKDKNLYGSVYSNTKDVQLYAVKNVEADPETGKAEVRQVTVNRNKAFDSLMYAIRAGEWRVKTDQNQDVVITQLTDMSRVRDYTREDEVTFVWRKSAQGNDHFHNALLYCWIASQMRGASNPGIIIPTLVSKFKVEAGQT